MQNIKTLPFLAVKGSHYNIGFQIGKKFCSRIQQAINESSLIQKRINWDRQEPNRLEKAVELTKPHFPDYFEEIKGIADGANINYRTILLLNFIHLPALEDCSSSLFKNNDTIFIIHNEDHEYGIGYHSYLIKAEYSNGIKIFAHCYPGVIPGLSFGFNSYGICMTCNYVPDPKHCLGIPRILIGRWILDASDINEARQRAIKLIPRMGGVNWNLVDANQLRISNIETTADDYCETEITDRYFHANHYTSQKFQHFPVPDDFEIRSIKRYKKGQELLYKVEKTKEGGLRILWDPIIHFEPQIIPSGEKFLTICTPVYEISKNKIHLSLWKKPNDQTPFFKYSLEELRK